MVVFGNDIWTTLGVIAWTARFPSQRMNDNLRATLQIQTSGTKDVPVRCQLPADLPVGRPADSGDQVTLETLESPPVAEKSTPVQGHSAETGQTPLRRSVRVRNPPDILMEKI